MHIPKLSKSLKLLSSFFQDQLKSYVCCANHFLTYNNNRYSYPIVSKSQCLLYLHTKFQSCIALVVEDEVTVSVKDLYTSETVLILPWFYPNRPVVLPKGVDVPSGFVVRVMSSSRKRVGSNVSASCQIFGSR